MLLAQYLRRYCPVCDAGDEFRKAYSTVHFLNVHMRTVLYTLCCVLGCTPCRGEISRVGRRPQRERESLHFNQYERD